MLIIINIKIKYKLIVIIIRKNLNPIRNFIIR